MKMNENEEKVMDWLKDEKNMPLIIAFVVGIIIVAFLPVILIGLGAYAIARVMQERNREAKPTKSR